MSRFSLLLRAAFVRALQSIITYLDLYLSHPRPQPVSFTRRINSTVGSKLGSFDLLFFVPPTYKKVPATKPSSEPSSTTKYPLLVNFHGGGFTIGHAIDDARWITAVVQHTSAVVVSVNYRLAPSNPFPVGIEDCVSAVLYLWQHAEELNLDISRTAFSGFSAGGNLTYAVSVRLHEELDRLSMESAFKDISQGKLVGLVSFYPSVDWTQTRQERDASNETLIPTIPHWTFRLFDQSYLYPTPDMKSPLLSPGKAPDGLLIATMPEKMVLIACRGDQLLKEDLKFADRLRKLGKAVDEMVIEGVGHGWDKRPTFKKGLESRDKAYQFAVEKLASLWDFES